MDTNNSYQDLKTSLSDFENQMTEQRARLTEHIHDFQKGLEELKESVAKLEKMVNKPPPPRNPSALEEFVMRDILYPLSQIGWYIQENAVSIAANVIFIGGVVMYLSGQNIK